jgi:1-deoxy-D-xylulose-5-phosphate reductoisomerase
MKVLLLGATGSIGSSTCNCIRRFPGRFELVGLSARLQTAALLELVREFHPQAVCVADEAAAAQVKTQLPDTVRFFSDESGLEAIVNETDFDVLLNALVGAVGLRATVAALKRNKRVALANKESLVVGGDYINSLLAQGYGSIIPVDSEHSAILQCLCGEKKENIESIILTASGGPFRATPVEALPQITVAQALNHPTWTMGNKITIDSATLVNKGFEVIEAHHLFHTPYSQLRVLIHPQSIIHSMVEFHDGAVIAQLGVPDMELPIQFALTWPERFPLIAPRLNLASICELTFFEPDYSRFPCLKLCLTAGQQGGTAPAIVNAANEIAVMLFLNERIRYDQIAQSIEDALCSYPAVPVDSLETIETIDKQVRTYILKRYG